jgi:Tol biopolymer transport system component
LIGTTLSHFEITAKLGEGGMGEVYRATDSQLGREVAIKVLPEAVASDPERLVRLEREAKILASLNHPNIAAIYSLESAEWAGKSAGPFRFLVMELVEGEDVAERIAAGPLPVDEALPIALQMAQALEAAHEKGIIHRDLKPANIKVDSQGKVKVLDFGLAKALEPETETDRHPSQSPLSMSPTLTRQMTKAGVILGTAAYMSPEQAKGKTIDKRADIWAFGVVLHEMLDGRKLFAADSVAETLAGVIKSDLDLGSLPPTLPAAVRRLLRRCLERDPRQRLHDIADARIVLEEVLSGAADERMSPVGSQAAPLGGWRRALPYLFAVVGLLIGLLAVARVWWLTNAPVQERDSTVQFGVLAPPQMELATSLAISPDGRHLVFLVRGENGRTSLWLRRLDSVVARPLGGTVEARYPFWSPDGLRVGFFASGQLQVTDLISNSPQPLAPASGAVNVRGASWGADDTIVYAPNYTGGLMRVSAAGGKPEPATRLPNDGSIGTHRFPQFLPDGRHFVFYGAHGGGIEPGELFLGQLGSTEVVALGPSSSRAVFAPPGYLLYVRGEALVAQRLDLESQRLAGEPISLEIGLPGSLAVSGYRSLSVSDSGILVYRQETRGTTSLRIVNRQGERIDTLAADREAWQYAPRLSPDGKRLLIARFESGQARGDLWIHDLERGIAERMTLEAGDESLAAWSPDQQLIAYDSIRTSPQYGVYVAPVGRPEEERLLIETSFAPGVDFWTADGESVVYEIADDSGNWGFRKVAADGTGQPEPFLQEPASQTAAALSSDGRWVAYTSDTTGQNEIYVRSADASGKALRVSAAGGVQPQWRHDGRELFFINAANELVAVPVTPGDPPAFGRGEVLFETRIEETTDRQYEESHDGQNFYVNESSSVSKEPIIVTTDWRSLLPASSGPSDP